MLPAVERDFQLGRNADLLEEALGARLEVVSDLDEPEERLRHVQAIEQASQYVALLREAAQAGAHQVRRYCFKVVFPDGRWSVAERELATPPQVGDCVRLEDGTAWYVSDAQFVWPRPSRKPRQEVYVLSPAA